MEVRLRTRTGYALIGLLAIIALIAYVAARDGCHSYATSTPQPMNGERLILSSGETVYFNGECWTKTPQPPTDLGINDSRP